MTDRDGRRLGAAMHVPANKDVAAGSESIGVPQGRGAATGGVMRRRAVRSPLVSETLQQESGSAALVGRPLLQEVLVALRQLPDRGVYEQLLRRIDAVEGIAQRAAARPDAASRLAPMLAELRSAVHVEIVTAVEQVSERLARSAAEQLAAKPEPKDPEAVAAAVDRRIQGAREQAERRIEARFAAVEKQLAELCERFSAAAAGLSESEGKGSAAFTAAMAEVSARLEEVNGLMRGGRLAGIEKKVDRLQNQFEKVAARDLSGQIDSLRGELTDLHQAVAAADPAEAARIVAAGIAPLDLGPVTDGLVGLAAKIETLAQRMDAAETGTAGRADQLEGVRTEIRALGEVMRDPHRHGELTAAIASLTHRVELSERAARAGMEQLISFQREARESQAQPDQSGAMEAIAAMNGRLERIERALAVRDPLLTNLGTELRALHTRLEESDARLREAVADSIDRAAGQAADRAIQRGDRAARLSVSAAAVDADLPTAEAEDRVPGAIRSHPEAAEPTSRRSRWSSAALLAVTAAVIAVPMVIAWQDIDSNMLQQRRDADVIQSNIRPAAPEAAPAGSSAGETGNDLAQVNDR